MARPIPREAPVTIATLPSREARLTIALMSIPVEAFEEPTSPPSAGTVAKIFIYGTLRRGRSIAT